MPILVNVLTAYTGVVEADAAENSVWRPSADLGGAYLSDCDSAGEPIPNSRPSGAAVVACLTLLQVITTSSPLMCISAFYVTLRLLFTCAWNVGRALS